MDKKDASFIDSIRNGKVKQPIQRGFSIKDWQKKYNSIVAPTDIDTKIFQTGLWFNNALEIIRNELSSIVKTGLTRESSIRLLVAYSNKFFFESDKPIFGNQKNRAGEIENVIDALRFPLNNAFTYESNIALLHSVIPVDIIDKIMKLGYSYHTFESLWNKCLWEDYYVDISNSIIRALDDELAKNRAIGRYRRDALETEIAAHTFDMLNKFPDILYEGLSSPCIVYAEFLEKGFTKLSANSPVFINGYIPDHLGLYNVARLKIYNYFGKDQIENNKNEFKLSVSDLLKTWYFFASVVDLLSERLMEIAKVDDLPIEQFLLYLSPLFFNRDLENLIQEYLGFTQRQSEKILEVLSFKGNPKEDLWLTPIIKINPNYSTCIFYALKIPNLVRSAEHWANLLGVNLTNKGKYFEKSIRDGLKDSNRISNAKIVPESVYIWDANKKIKEEIDLLIIFPNLLLVGEIKNLGYPVTSEETYRYYQKMDNAKQQVVRKSNFIRRNLQSINEYLRDQHENIDALQILPFLVINQSLGCGYNNLNVPVVDDYILQRYFRDGSLALLKIHSSDSIPESPLRVKFYENSKQAEERLRDYLLFPPAISNYDLYTKLDSVVVDLSNIINLKKFSVNMYYTNLEYVLALDDPQALIVINNFLDNLRRRYTVV